MELKSSAKLQYVKWSIPLLLLWFCLSAILPSQALCDSLDKWTAWDSGTVSEINGVTYDNSTFVAVGHNGTILQSDSTTTDDMTWKTWDSGTGNSLNGVSYGTSTFVAVGEK